MAMTALAVLAGFGAVTLANGPFQPLVDVPIFGVIGLLALWMQYRSAARVRNLVQSTTIELDDHQLTGSNTLETTVILREEVVEVRQLPDGLLVRGRSLRQTLQLKPELDEFDDLAARLQEWIPAGARRTQSSTPLTFWLFALLFANLGLMVSGMAVKSPKIAIPCCIAEATVLLGCLVFVLRSKVGSRVKWSMLLVLLPAISLVSRAYLLSK